MKRFYEKLLEYGKGGLYPLHMPGHKRKEEMFPTIHPYSIDITEIDGFDDLHHARGELLHAMEHAAKVFGSDYAYFLVNGSTCGILAAVSALVKKGDKVMVARNCHISVYHALFLQEANPVYIYPKTVPDFGITGAVLVDEVERRIRENPDVACVIITSPTYEGVVSDINGIAKTTHKLGIPLIVDEAHGAHFGFHEAFPRSAVDQRADVVIHGLHKTLPAFTQSALLHLNGDLVSKEKVEKYLSIYQSSSPSYLLLCGMDRCMWFLEEEGERRFGEYANMLQDMYHRLKDMKSLTLFHGVKGIERDWSKVVVSTKGTSINGRELYRRLREEYRFQPEMASLDYIIAMTGVCDEEEELRRLTNALLKIDEEIGQKKQEAYDWFMDEKGNLPLLPIRMNSYDAYRKEGVLRPIGDCEGEVAKEMVYAYPPGIPLIVPGEEITGECICLLNRYKEEGWELRGLRDVKQGMFEVVAIR